MKRDDPVAALEIGTSRTVLAVGEPLPNGHVRIAAKAAIPSTGVRKSRIVDIEQATHSVASVLRRLKDADYDLGQAYLAVTGPHVETQRHVTDWELGGRVVSDEDLVSVYNRSCDVGVNDPKRALLDVAELGYGLDDLDDVPSPKGMSGRLLKLSTLSVFGSADRIADARAAASAAKLEIVEPYFAGTCAANAVLTDEMKRAGALVVDLGGGSTTCCAYADGHLAWTHVLGVGGDHVTNDVRHAFNLNNGQAEDLKVKFASCLPSSTMSEERVEIPSSTPGFAPTFVSRRALDVVVNARMSELFSIILECVDDANLIHRLGAGVVITGGGAALRGADRLAASTFGLSCSVGRIVPEIEGLDDEPTPAAFASVAGLALVAAGLSREPSSPGLFSSIFKGIFRK